MSLRGPGSDSRLLFGRRALLVCDLCGLDDVCSVGFVLDCFGRLPGSSLSGAPDLPPGDLLCASLTALFITVALDRSLLYSRQQLMSLIQDRGASIDLLGLDSSC